MHYLSSWCREVLHLWKYREIRNSDGHNTAWEVPNPVQAVHGLGAATRRPSSSFASYATTWSKGEIGQEGT